MEYDIVVALTGQPNVGKSTVFNRMVGRGKSHVGNWPGKTVELIKGIKEYKDYKILFVDLPGIYDLIGSSEEEEIAIKYLLGEIGETKHKHRSSLCEICPFRRFCPIRKICPLRRIFGKKEDVLYTPDVVVVILDANNLISGLAFLMSIREIFDKVVVAINKIDEIKTVINTKELESFFGSPVVKISAIKNVGIEKLLEKIVEVWKKRRQKELIIDYGKNIEEKIAKISKEYGIKRGVAIKLLEGARIKGIKIRDNFREEIKKIRIETSKKLIENVEGQKEEVLGKIDNIFFQKTLGPTLSFIILLFSIFLTFTVNTGFPLSDIFRIARLEGVSNFLEEYNILSIMEKISEFVIYNFKLGLTKILPEKIAYFITDGLIGGFLFLISFVPIIFSLLFFMTLLEDSGLFARIALSLHRIMSKLGLSGKAIFPLMFGFGCNVPAIVSTRILEKKEKIAISLSTPFVICQARLVVLAALTSILPISMLGKILFIILVYSLSIFLYLFIGNLIARLSGKREGTIIIEIPKLRMPSIRVAFWDSWMLTKHFIEKAGTMIVLLSAVVWILIESGGAERIGRTLEPLLYPIGIKSWKISFAVFQGLIAKEGFLVTLNQLYGGKGILEMEGLKMPQMVSLILFIMFYVPCIATVVTIKRETNSSKIAILSVSLSLFVAYLISMISYYSLNIIF